MKLLAALVATAIAVLATADVGLAQTPLSDISGLGTAFAVSPPRLEIAVSPGTSEVTSEISVTNLSPQREILTTTLNDMLITKAGAYQAIAADTTSSSIARAGNLIPEQVELSPAGSPGATTNITLTVQWTDPDHALYGAIVVEPVVSNPPAPTGGGPVRVTTKIQPAVLIPLVLVPTQLDAATNELKPVVRVDLEPASIVIDQPQRAAGLDRLIPFTLPRVADHGPVEARVTVVNTGDALSRAITHYQFTSVNILAWLPQSWQNQIGVKDTLFLQVDSAPGPALPGDLATTAAGTEVNEPDHVFDVAPIAGLVRVTAETRMTLVDTTSRSVTQSGWIIVFPWKETGSLLLIFGAIVMVRRARAKRPGRWLGPPEDRPQLPVIREDVRGGALDAPVASSGSVAASGTATSAQTARDRAVPGALPGSSDEPRKPRLSPVGMTALRVTEKDPGPAQPGMRRLPAIRLFRRLAAGTVLACMALAAVPAAASAAPTATVMAAATATAAGTSTEIATATPVRTSTSTATPGMTPTVASTASPTANTPASATATPQATSTQSGPTFTATASASPAGSPTQSATETATLQDLPLAPLACSAASISIPAALSLTPTMNPLTGATASGSTTATVTSHGCTATLQATAPASPGFIIGDLTASCDGQPSVPLRAGVAVTVCSGIPKGTGSSIPVAYKIAADWAIGSGSYMPAIVWTISQP